MERAKYYPDRTCLFDPERKRAGTDTQTAKSGKAVFRRRSGESVL